jgi:flagellar assembly protein FliH
MEIDNSFRPLELRHKFSVEVEETGVSPEELLEDMLAQARDRLIRAEEEARAIIDGATAEAADVIRNAMADARREAEEIKKEAGEKGFSEGKKEALAKAATEAGAIREQARSVLRQAEEIRRQTLDGIEGEIIELAKEMAAKILFSEIRQNPEIIMAVAGEAIDLLKDRDEVALYVNPSEASIFEQRKMELKQLLSPKAVLHILPDAGVSPGGVVAETRYGKVDANLGARWQALLQALHGENS